MTPVAAPPLLTLAVLQQLLAARSAGIDRIQCSLDLERSQTLIAPGIERWTCEASHYPYPTKCKERTIYYWTGASFEPVARYAASLIKLVPTQWGAPTFEIDGIKMLPTLLVSPYEDAERKVKLIQPRGKTVLDTCGGLGYFAAWCLQGAATRVISFEKNQDVIWLRSLNPWSPPTNDILSLTHGDVTAALPGLANDSVDAVLHDPPRFGIAGELYSQSFYEQLARVLKRRGRLFHYTGAPNKHGGGRDVPNEVSNRLSRAGFRVEKNGDGLLAVKN